MRIRILSVATLLLPAALAAQPSASAPQQAPANPITLSFKAAGSRYAGLLTQAFDSIPASKYGFKPTPVQQSVGYVAQHLENANYFLCSRFGGAPRTMTAKDSLADSVKANWPKDTLTARLKASFAYCDAAMANVNDAKLSDELPTGPAGSGRTTARARYVLGYVTDLVDHYSQIANYMRLNGMIPPSSLPQRPRM
ncbi:MAG TPA: DinB family protein [Gemmatimonadaceae bacterium]